MKDNSIPGTIKLILLTASKRNPFSLLGMLLLIPLLFLLVMLATDSSKKINNSQEKNFSECINENLNCQNTEYARFTEKVEENGIIIEKNYIIAYSKIQIIHVNSYNDISEDHKISAKNNPDIYIFSGDVKFEIGKLVHNEKLSSEISLNSNEIQKIDLYLQRYKSSQGPPEKVIYIVGQIIEFKGPNQYNRSKTRNIIIDLTKPNERQNEFEEIKIPRELEDEVLKESRNYEYKSDSNSTRYDSQSWKETQPESSWWKEIKVRR